MACKIINLGFACFLFTLALLAIVQNIRERDLPAQIQLTTPFDTLTGVRDNLTQWSTPTKRYAPWQFIDMRNVPTNDTDYCMVYVQFPESDPAAWTAYPIFISVFNNDFTALHYTDKIHGTPRAWSLSSPQEVYNEVWFELCRGAIEVAWGGGKQKEARAFYQLVPGRHQLRATVALPAAAVANKNCIVPDCAGGKRRASITESRDSVAPCG
ncbi:hypothetical protein QBC38DRAFT_449198 [Podospora fimiseda]|uniref:Uncharacterized protein n=1 Tax=Podospora fimiseda TaxID=252190 RepID=A0AAN6YLF0_9PEZI|nr:hypothetical protein QBC38DRAFT_449198 [Podospora fimiseda]